MIKVKQKGNLLKVTQYLQKVEKAVNINLLKKYGEQGVAALSAATPVDTGLTASSWFYKIKQEPGKVTLSFCNDHRVKGVMIAIILQYGHGTRNGGYVQGRDYINPALKPVFDKLAKEAWEEVTKL